MNIQKFHSNWLWTVMLSGATWLAFRWYDPTSPWTEILEHSATMSVVLDGIVGVHDADDACRRVVLREIAEVAGYPNLAHYRLLMETEVKPLYFKEYRVHVDFNA